MSEVRFYHLQTKDFGQALPQVLTKVLKNGQRAVVQLPDDTAAEKMAVHLWAYDTGSFLPHGTKKDGFETDQPIYITAKAENPNTATVLITGNGAVPESIETFALVCEFLDGHNQEQILAARKRWVQYKEAGHTVTYWQQTENGGWEQKA